MDDIYRTLRRRQDDFAAAQDQKVFQARGGVQKALFSVINGGSMPGSLPAVFATRRVVMNVAETEGAVPSFTAASGTTYVTVIGTRVPNVGDILKARLVNGRWLAEKGGSSITGFNIHLGICSVPGYFVLGVAGFEIKIYDSTHTTLLVTHDNSLSYNSTLPFGNYTIDISEIHAGPARFVPVVNYPITVDIGHRNFTIPLTPDSNYVCTGLCYYPIRKTLNFTYGARSGTMTWRVVTSGSPIAVYLDSISSYIYMYGFNGNLWVGSATDIRGVRSDLYYNFVDTGGDALAVGSLNIVSTDSTGHTSSGGGADGRDYAIGGSNYGCPENSAGGFLFSQDFSGSTFGSLLIFES